GMLGLGGFSLAGGGGGVGDAGGGAGGNGKGPVRRVEVPPSRGVALRRSTSTRSPACTRNTRSRATSWPFSVQLARTSYVYGCPATSGGDTKRRVVPPCVMRTPSNHRFASAGTWTSTCATLFDGSGAGAGKARVGSASI